MRLFEYEGKKLFQEAGIQVPPGKVAATVPEAVSAAATIGGEVMLKAQVPIGKRGKAGGVRSADSAAVAEEIASKLLGSELNGYPVQSLLVEQKLDIAKEIYLGITVDRTSGRPVAVASTSGGVSIEEVAQENPEKISSILIDPLTGIRDYQAVDLLLNTGLQGGLLASVSRILVKLYRVFSSNDASLCEINPLVQTKDNKLIAADARVEIDDHSLFKHPRLEKLNLERIDNIWEKEAVSGGVNYVDMDGNIAVMANGAGLTMALLDMIRDAGGSPAGFLETGGGLSRQRMKNGVCLLLRKAQADKRIKVILVMARMMISPPDAVADGMLEAIAEVKIDTPVIAVMRGRKQYETKAKELLAGSGVPIFDSVEAGIEEAIRIAGGEK